MGLDVYAFSKIQPSKDEDDFCIHRDQDFPERVADMPAGRFTGRGRFSFRAGSYSGYGIFRDELAVLAGFASAKEARDATGGVCWELINFSDCEGAIGATVSAKLAKDFASLQEEANKRWAGAEWKLGVFNNFRKAFDLAADGGVVVFR